MMGFTDGTLSQIGEYWSFDETGENDWRKGLICSTTVSRWGKSAFIVPLISALLYHEMIRVNN